MPMQCSVIGDVCLLALTCMYVTKLPDILLNFRVQVFTQNILAIKHLSQNITEISTSPGGMTFLSRFFVLVFLKKNYTEIWNSNKPSRISSFCVIIISDLSVLAQLEVKFFFSRFSSYWFRLIFANVWNFSGIIESRITKLHVKLTDI